jgi:DNA primase
MGGVMRPVYDIVKSEGFELTERGHSWRGLCPLHDRDGRNFSFVCGDTWWKCFSCGEHGDGPALIMRLKGMTFPQALAYLGEERQRPTAQEKAQRAKESKAKAAAEWREREIARTLGITIRESHKMLLGITPESFTSPEFELLLSELSIVEYQHKILIEGDQEERAAVVRDLAGLRLFKRTLLFKKNFDFRAWLRATMKKYAPAEATKGSQNEMHRASISFV